MADLTFTSKDPLTLPANALVVGVTDSDGTLSVVGPDSLDVAPFAGLDLKALGASAAADSVVRIPAPAGVTASIVVLVGLGKAPYGREEQLRRAAGSAVRALSDFEAVVIALPATEVEDVNAIAEGAQFGAYAYRTYRTGDAATKGNPVAKIEIATPLAKQSGVKKGAARVAALAQAVSGTRDLVNAAPNDLFPASFTDIAKAAAKGTGVKVQILDEKALLAGGYGGIMGVGQGSSRGPRMVKLSYTPLRAKKKVALVGKGITFDTGGISIKPAAGMEAMKNDMAGAAAVLHTVLAAAKLGLNVNVYGYLCLAENMPSGTATRPSDVLTIRGGKTVEVLNTDAEGRLVMADGLVSATEDNPDLIIDIATLTGAQVMALGNRVAAVMGTDDAVTDILEASASVGEPFWSMPLPEELRPTLDSQVADIANIGTREGGMLSAGHFLKEFTNDLPWAHLDVAGPAFNEAAPYGYTHKGGTGFGVRTMLGVLEAYAK
ncbi:leucyl aminopeptidase [Jonesiaceae bacterium BS-20]|uniref:Probable cytosol aminopeptidase n=1 Tax=Jonesiaceae bacterium BS-20 TaxID=3120821 RepID=A0AAU7DSZ8_9MICO